MPRFNRWSTAESVTADLDLSGQTALITGCNSGIGQETARVLAARGAHVIGLARTLEKAQLACVEFGANVTPVACELADFASVQAAAAEVLALDRPIDMLICNAGIMALPRRELRDGIEMQLRTNHFGHFQLVHALLPQVRAANVGRIVIVSSLAHTFAPRRGVVLDDLAMERFYNPWLAYGQSKLANILHARELNTRLDTTSVTASAVHPGVIATNLGRNMGGAFDFAFTRLARPFIKNVGQGAATTCYAATRPEIEGVGGKYYADCRATWTSRSARNRGLARDLWETSERVLREQGVLA